MSHSFKTHYLDLRHTRDMHTLVILATLAQAADVSALSWMAGCWRQESSGRIVDEVWMAPRGDGMLGMSRTVAKDRIVEHEFLQIRVQEGRLVYIAKPSRQAEATFTAVAASAREVIFENPTHDFPQRIVYRLQSDGNLAARIEGTEKGQARGIDFPMVRVACAGK
jgi:hypothetical protein